MIELHLKRVFCLKESTVGVLKVKGKTFFTLERPWRQNKVNVSCVPCGEYVLSPHGWELHSKVKFKRVWRLNEVEGRTSILIHAGNYHHDSFGCILVGNDVTIRRCEATVLDSRNAIEELRTLIGEKPSKIIIKKENVI